MNYRAAATTLHYYKCKSEITRDTWPCKRANPKIKSNQKAIFKGKTSKMDQSEVVSFLTVATFDVSKAFFLKHFMFKKSPIFNLFLNPKKA